MADPLSDAAAQMPLIQGDAAVLGLLALCLGLVFYTENSKHPACQRFYRYVPSLLLCYLLPSLLNSAGIISGEHSNIYYVTSRFLLPAALVLLTLSIDLNRIIALGPKAIIMFLTGTVGIVVGGPIAVMLVGLVSPETVGGAAPDEIWRGLSTIAGSWIGGGANQTAMYEMWQVSDEIFPAMIAVDIIMANIWLAVLLVMAGRAEELDEKRGADASAIYEVRDAVEHFHRHHARMPLLPDFMAMLAVGLGVMGLSHLAADAIAPWIGGNFPALNKFSLGSQFFWLVVLATTAGLALSFTPVRRLEAAGASRVGSIFIYFLVASIGMKMDITAIVNHPGIFVVGLIWISIHAVLLLVVARIIRAPTFFIAVGSQANVGGAASAPVVAAAFHPSLAPVGVLLAVLGYALGTYAAWLCAVLMQLAAPVG
ncbi:DUF819 domain-containing protein [Parahaliea mediterranea]|uniref:DUF819 family protein n=1 Tax=Parahaliea mediterranea TaxID=651086 RepID=A0A939DGX7_9GAMM|nr:DUF819 family protein [Parahaliea mediterranea]MBN7797920.1 DUF819 family protein [Parahaliea mediterranea]